VANVEEKEASFKAREEGADGATEMQSLNYATITAPGSDQDGEDGDCRTYP
jgi:hypothetical protein